MNIIRPGDHIVLAYPMSYPAEVRELVEGQIQKIPEVLADTPGPITMTWLAVGAPDSSPYVLFVVREFD